MRSKFFKLIRANSLLRPRSDSTDSTKSQFEDQRGEFLNLDAARAISPNCSMDNFEKKKASLFGDIEYENYILSKDRGRRPNVLSLEVNQTFSLVKVDVNDDVYLSFRFMPKRET